MAKQGKTETKAIWVRIIRPIAECSDHIRLMPGALVLLPGELAAEYIRSDLAIAWQAPAAEEGGE